MAILKPFKAYRPKPTEAKLIAAYPYDVVNSAEAREIVGDNPLSFLRVGKPEITLPEETNLYDAKVYEQGKSNLLKLISEGHLIEDKKPNFYLYMQEMNGRKQFGIVGCASVDDYWDDVIKKHEKTRAKKEEDRCNHVRVTNAHTGPIFLTFRDTEKLNELIERIAAHEPDNDHVADDGIRHTTWIISDDDDIKFIEQEFSNIPTLYVADGHHRSAAAAIVGRERQKANPEHTGNEEYNFFLAVCFPASQLHIMDYNRVVKDLNNMTEEEFFGKLKEYFTIEEKNIQYKPEKKGEFGLYISNKWYKLTADEKFTSNPDPVESLDVAILQNFVLDKMLGIKDPRTDDRIDFVGGIRGLNELEKRVNSGEMKFAIAMYPTSIDELMNIADAGEIMPPKSTWFEPKLRDGLFIHFLD